jgi:hypothetical protein
MRRVAQAILRTYLSRILALGLGGRQLRREYYVCSVINGPYMSDWYAQIRPEPTRRKQY